QTEYNEQLMKLIDKQYIETPFYGIDKMTKWLRLQDHSAVYLRFLAVSVSDYQMEKAIDRIAAGVVFSISAQREAKAG
ncbi:unnamed protein product, partial [marine sediment metagenome]